MIQIPAEIRDAMVRHSFDCLPNEACGLLAGRDGRVERFYPMRNADHIPSTYRLDPTEQLRVFNEIEEAGLDLTGIFHSHTQSEAYPSPTDERQAFYPEARYVLVSLADPDRPTIRAYSIADGAVAEEEVAIR